VVTPYSPTPPHQQIAEAIRRDIAAGRLAPGDRLGGAREMADRYRVGEGTIARALAVLKAEGLVETARGQLPWVREPVELEPRPVPKGSRIRLRMPTPEERAEHQIPEGVPVAEVTTARTVTLYIGDRDELTT
jgi:DNA-binding transcriptional regulator YhcF (GntR family)